MKSRITCAMCGHETPVTGGRGHVVCSCGMRIEVAAARQSSVGPVVWTLALLASAAGALFWVWHHR